jgi:hypothetical protein
MRIKKKFGAKRILAAIFGLSVLISTQTLASRAYADTGDPIQFTQWGTVYPASGWSFVSGDFTGDGRTDVMGYDPGNGSLWIGTNMGTSFSFSQWATVAPASGWSFVAGDFTGDGHIDVMGYDPGDGSLWIGTNTGASFSFSKWGTVGPASGWSFVSGDFTGDGRIDVMGYYSGNGTLWVGTNTGSSFSFKQWGSVAPASGWSFVPGDFNRDGSTDVMGYYPGNGTLWVGANTGSSFAVTQWGTVYPSSGWKFVPGSFSGDGNTDLLGYSSQAGTLSLIRNAASNFYVAPVAWGHVHPPSTYSFAAGNFTSDGRLDLFGYESSSGTVWVGANAGLPPEGYASPLSAAPGGTIAFHVSGVAEPTVTFMRHSTDAQGNVVSTPMGSTSFTSSVHPLHAQAWASDAGWPPSFTVTVPSSWPSGMYSAQLTSLAGANSYITFVVKPDPSHLSNVAVIANINTWDAYNEWGGKGKYDGAAHTTLLRPNPAAAPVGEGFQQHHLARAELWIYGWLEQQGFQPDLYTDIDLTNGIPLVRNGVPTYKKLVVDTHPEYWTTQEYSNLNTFLNDGGSLAYLGGNGIYENCSYDSTQSQVIFYNGVEQPANPNRTPYLFRNIGLPEINLLGIANLTSSVPDTPYNVTDASSQIFNGTGLMNGNEIGTSGLNTGGTNEQGYTVNLQGRAAGWEVDSTTGDPNHPPPSGVDIVAESSSEINGVPAYAQMVFWTFQPGGGHVYSVGSIAYGGSLVKDTALQQTLLNFMNLP